MKSSITSSFIPNLINEPTVAFDGEKFDVLLFEKGYDVIVEQAIQCPCRSKDNGSPLSTCENCSGTGWSLINPNKTKVVISSMNLATKYKSWSKELIGTASITSRSIDRINFMDRITLMESEVIYSQTLYPQVYKDVLFSFVIYPILEVKEVFIFVDSNVPLLKLNESQYSFDSNKLILNDQFKDVDNLTCSIRYLHHEAYHIVDTVKHIRDSRTVDSKGYAENQVMSQQSVGRLAHYMLDEKNFEGVGTFDNSYTK